jgi:hypothetical protein
VRVDQAKRGRFFGCPVVGAARYTRGGGARRS